MKKILEVLRGQSKAEKWQFFGVMLAVAVSVCSLFLDLSDSQSWRTAMIIILLDALISISYMERFGILERIESKCENKDGSAAYLTTRKAFNRKYPVEDLWDGATEICLLAIANTSFLRGNGVVQLHEAAKKGTKINLLSLEPTASVAKEYEQSKILSPVSIPLEENVKAFQKSYRENEYFRRNVAFRLCNTIIPYSMMIVKSGDTVKHIQVDLYYSNAEIDGYMGRRSVIVPSTDVSNIKFFTAQWNALWNDPANRVVKG